MDVSKETPLKEGGGGDVCNWVLNNSSEQATNTSRFHFWIISL